MHARTRWLAVVRTPLGVAALILVVAMVALAVLGPMIWGDRAAQVDTDAIHQGPSAAHLLGTDGLGRDILARVLVATRMSLGLAALAVAIAVGLGILIGTAPSVLPRRLGRLITGAVNIAVAFPALLLALFFAVVFGVGTQGAVFGIGLAGAPSFARLTQTLSASIDGLDFVAAARVAGVGRLRILRRHLLPNIAEPLVVNATVGAGAALLAFAGLSFLGIGVQAPSYDWGRLLGDGVNRIYANPAGALGPALAVMLAGLAFNLLGETAAAVVGGRARTRPGRAPTLSPAAVDRAADNEVAHNEVAGSLEAPDDEIVLRVDDLQVSFPAGKDWVTPVRGVSLTLRAGEAVGIVGESGSGKSLTALAASRLIEEPGVVEAARLDFCGIALSTTPERETRRLLGRSLAMVFQDPMKSFNPTMRVGRQLAETAVEHQDLDRRSALARAVDRLDAVRVPDPARRARQHPHEFSGGMLQRAMIGMGLMNTPRLVVADEPTTALDVTVQRQVLRLLAEVRAETHAAILLISHDIAVISQMCDRVLVMYAGRIVEDLPVTALQTARHPYTRALLDVVPDLDADRTRPLKVIAGRPPEPSQFPTGCAFADRCGLATAACREEDPQLRQVAGGHGVACWHPVEGENPVAQQAFVPIEAVRAGEIGG
ncbi:dipeptide/oligopeptide/nickel ABC transporter permease/ATP-binding protein [Nocardioides sp. QY071]|uniref:dipeptide/oligopeptide/nickel ABC transporter permease/ATP-binding protein n=1 Tax=Nocardioides sp. QY071 TaxID=3044187 RepID=UPI002499C69A|nr:dipeptide/oligopeptide/nickel ABC transporter permease/ATP-binding protein [Nocardioides sp. QY071]WGY00419.1 dipeptide/oligopeptide/nickel ABC transporter permease/ATP-binding protein [Nocardioides sp. QY071]